MNRRLRLNDPVEHLTVLAEREAAGRDDPTIEPLNAAELDALLAELAGAELPSLAGLKREPHAARAVVPKAEPPSAAKGAADYAPLPKHVGRVSVVTTAGRRMLGQKNSDGELEPLCSLFELGSAVIWRDRENSRALELNYENEFREKERILVPAEMVSRRDALVSFLRSKGMLFASNAGEKFVQKLMMTTQPPGKSVYDRAGWVETSDGLVFLSPTGAVIFGDPERYGIADELRFRKVPPKAGTLEGWMAGAEAIFGFAVPTMQASLLAGFMGPLLGAVGRAPIVQLLTGVSSSGKSWRQAVGVAVMGPSGPGDGSFRSFNSTEGALELPLQQSSCAVAAFDETAFVDAKVVKRLVFLASGEQGRG